MHLSRLWTDTQVQRKLYIYWDPSRKVRKMQIREEIPEVLRRARILTCAVLLKRSTSAPVTSVDRHPSTLKFNLRPKQRKRN